MKRKLIIGSTLVFFLIVTGFTNVTAQTKQQDQRKPRPLPDANQIVQMVEDLSAAISLTEEQKKQVLEMHQSHYERVKAFKEGSKELDRDKKREEMQKLRKEFETEINSVLSKEQQIKYKAFEKEKRAKQGKPERQK